MGMGMGGRGRGSQRYGAGYGPPPPEYGPHADSPVLMVYGLEPLKINADRVFNIFCLYGNIERCHFLRLLVIVLLFPGYHHLFSSLVHIDIQILFVTKLKDPRLLSPQCFQAAGHPKNRIQHPSNVLHFFNAQPEITEETFFQICEELGIKSPTSIKLFTGKSEYRHVLVTAGCCSQKRSIISKELFH
ncbi:hypothetical protein GOODEAATRI_018650 [Goodea atripinnis]|uniref:Heterogeneous nuclear ribonucleoprotein L RRM domain-containing protein n=1 Tax=Goodea atripinnis TaxID=208336 RepID=A0ABV0NBN0_9TELE